MSTRTARRLVACAWALTLALLAAAHAFWALLDDVPNFGDVTTSFLLIVTALALTYSSVGGVVAMRRPSNPVGWIFLAGALSASLTLASAVYAQTAVPVPASGRVPGTELAAWVAGGLAFPTVALVALLLLLYPDGRPPSRRWRLAAWLIGAATVTSVIGAFAPGRIEDQGTPVENPLGVEGTLGNAIAGLRPVAGILLQLSLVLGLLSMVVRFRRSQGDERLQLKWFVLTIAFIVVSVVAAGVAQEVAPAGNGDANPVEETFALLALLGVAALPVAAAIAILKHRLYDIDVVINRALVYGALTASLAASYLGLVLLLQLVLSPLTESSNLAIAGSTLAVAGLFRPARGRIQDLVDRRFYRRRYDAERTLERFGGRLREEVDLEALRQDLALAVRETLQPAHVSLWLRSDR